ncbi:MAG: helicase C-terminal domain-containing protein [Nitrososphaerota archaeon]
MEKNLKVLWLTRTGSQVAHVSKETRSLPIYGRRMVCLHEAVSKTDLRRFNSTCRAVRRAGRCPYWPGMPRALNPPLTVGEVKNVAKRFPACPHDCLIASLTAVRSAVATHMQLNSIAWLLSKWRARRENTILVLDEGQHIVKNALSMVKDSISIRTVEKASREARKYGFNELSEEIENAVEHYRSMLQSDGEMEVEDILPDADELALAGDEIQEMKLKENYVPASYVLSLADFKIALNGRKPILVREGRSIRLEAPVDPIDYLKTIYDGWSSVVTMSATISGELLESFIGVEAVLLRSGWPFGDNLRSYIVKGLTTKFERRDETLMDDMAWITKLALKSGKKTLIFFPSHELLQATIKKIDGKEKIMFEEPGIEQEEVEGIAERFEEGGGVLASVFNGRLSEGVDLSANLVICLGVPFSPPTVKQTALLKRLGELLKDEKKARIYGQILPAVWSAIQASGRAIRGPQDRALVFMVDDRYRVLYRLLPRWFQERIVSSINLRDMPIIMEVDENV